MSSAQAAVDLGRQSLDAEQKKYALGASTTTLVLQNRSALAQAESTLVSAMAAYEKAQVELDRATGLLLDHTGILLADAERGEVTHMPSRSLCGARPDVPASVMPADSTAVVTGAATVRSGVCGCRGGKSVRPTLHCTPAGIPPRLPYGLSSPREALRGLDHLQRRSQSGAHS